MEVEVSTSEQVIVNQTMDQLLVNVEDMEVAAGPATQTTSSEDTTPLSPILSMAEIKVEDEEKKSTSTTSPAVTGTNATTAQIQTQTPRPPAGRGDQDSDGPLVIDLSDDDEEEYSKENIEKAPAKSLNGLMKSQRAMSLSNEEIASIHSKVRIAVQKLSRAELEDMYCAKISEWMELDKYIRKLELKVANLSLYRDRVTKKVMYAEKQVRLEINCIRLRPCHYFF